MSAIKDRSVSTATSLFSKPFTKDQVEPVCARLVCRLRSRACVYVRARGIIHESLLTGGRGFDRPNKSYRRTIAAPIRGVFHGRIVQTHGDIAPAFLMGAPCGKPSGLPFPVTRSVNPHGVAHPLTGVGGKAQFVTGFNAMQTHLGAHSRTSIFPVFSSVEG